MSTMVEVNAVVRTEMLDRVIHMLRGAGIPRMTVIPVHAIGRGVDPEAAKLSVQEGTQYADKAMVQFICAGEQCHRYTELICKAARTGRRGDGIVSVRSILGVTKIRTGVQGPAALQ
ncbi:MAG: P-II family nitrogen regulator [Gemmatimonadales bacterium]|nr:MAG: P-II family nitrogen regulator [Gemmatimonadales bacterium]